MHDSPWMCSAPSPVREQKVDVFSTFSGSSFLFLVYAFSRIFDLCFWRVFNLLLVRLRIETDSLI